MHPLDKAEKILRGIWPKNGTWIYESPDKGQSVYRRLGTFRPRQLIHVNGKPVADEDTLDEEYMKLSEKR